MIGLIHRSLVSGALASVVLSGSALPREDPVPPAGLNIDLGQLIGSPSDSFGGAANQPGHWVSMSALDFCTFIFDHEHATLFFYHLYTAGTAGATPFPAISGEEEAMMEDFHVLDPLGTPTKLYLFALQPGHYDAYVYSWSADDPFAVVETWMDGPVVHAPVTIHGAGWPGAQVEGMTYSRMSFDVGETPIEIYARNVSGNGVINGVQIVRVDEIGTNFCTSTPNSTGEPAVTGAFGRTSVAANNLTLSAGPIGATQPAIFYYGQDETSVPFGNGTRCISGQVHRLYPFSIADSSGYVTKELDLNMPPIEGHWAPATTWKFQTWYRDPEGGGLGFDLSNGLSVTFTP
jgi:hypothetical protein